MRFEPDKELQQEYYDYAEHCTSSTTLITSLTATGTLMSVFSLVGIITTSDLKLLFTLFLGVSLLVASFVIHNNRIKKIESDKYLRADSECSIDVYDDIIMLTTILMKQIGLTDYSIINTETVKIIEFKNEDIESITFDNNVITLSGVYTEYTEGRAKSYIGEVEIVNVYTEIISLIAELNKIVNISS